MFAEYHLHSNHNYYPQRSVRNRRFKLIHNLMPNAENPGLAFTVSRFVDKQEMAQALSEAEEHIRVAYESMGWPPEYELYDLATDPFEFRNLAGLAEHGGVLSELQSVLAEWRKESLDPFLEPSNVTRLKAEIESTLKDGKYERPAGWMYRDYLAPDSPPWTTAP